LIIKRLYIIILFIITVASTKAQDIHFSQFYSAPLQLNPALTGFFPCVLRFGLNYRSQWAGFAPFKTQAVWGDGKLNKRFFRNDWIGVGGMIYGDQAVELMKNIKFMISGAYHKGLIRGDMLTVNAGASLGLVNKSYNSDDLLFDSQWNGNTFTSSIDADENFVDNSIFYLDMNVGVFADFKKPKYGAFLGASMNHLNAPDISFTTRKENMGRRNVIHGGGFFKRGNVTLKPQFMFSSQRKSKEIIIGTNFIFALKPFDLYLGIWDRLSGDIIPTIGFDWRGWLVLFTYDFNYGDLRPITGMKGGWEISLSKTFGCKDKGSSSFGGIGIGKNRKPCPAYQ